jgi:hypothetical protein
LISFVCVGAVQLSKLVAALPCSLLLSATTATILRIREKDAETGFISLYRLVLCCDVVHS